MRRIDGNKKPAGKAGSLQNNSGPEYSTNPDPRASRRRFLVTALMAGWLRPERVAQSIAAELDQEAAR